MEQLVKYIVRDRTESDMEVLMKFAQRKIPAHQVYDAENAIPRVTETERAFKVTVQLERLAD